MNILPVISYITPKYAMKCDKEPSVRLAFKGFREEIAKSMHNEIRTMNELTSTYDRFMNMALKEGKTSLERCLEPITTISNTIKTKLEYAKKFSDGEDYIILSDSKGPLVSMRYGTVTMHGDYNEHLSVHEHIDFYLDDKGNYVIERPFDKAKFYPNHNLKEFTKYTTDYTESKTTYYKEDGTERNFRNFLSFFGL